MLDGADDQDHDDVPNLMELSRWRATFGARGVDGAGKAGVSAPLPVHGRVNPYNPCLPYPSRALQTASVDRDRHGRRSMTHRTT